MKINIKSFFHLDNKGQGLIEVFIAIYLFLVALLSMMNLVSYNMLAQNFNHNMFIASNLAREGIEVVRNIRDTNWLNSDSETGQIVWDNFLTYHESENFGANANESNPENSFYILNNYIFDGDFVYSINSLGLSWKNCVDESYKNFGTNFMEYGGLFCKMDILENKFNEETFLYSIFGSGVLQELVNPTSFYRMITINEICTDGNEEFILDGNNGWCVHDNCYDEHCLDFGLEKIGLQVISRAAWKNSGRMNTITLEDHLYNWK